MVGGINGIFGSAVSFSLCFACVSSRTSWDRRRLFWSCQRKDGETYTIPRLPYSLKESHRPIHRAIFLPATATHQRWLLVIIPAPINTRQLLTSGPPQCGRE